MSDDYKAVQKSYREMLRPVFHPKGREVEGTTNARGSIKLGRAGHRLGKKGPNQKVNPPKRAPVLRGTNKERFLARKVERDSKR